MTNIQNHNTIAPTAKECGSCHVEQYAEWQKTAHAQAFISPEFKRRSDQYQERDCLFCHSPGDIQNPERVARSYNRDEGITCVSCHLHEHAMHGPHESGALFSPHAVVKDGKLNSTMESSQLCGICHEETYEQWQSSRKGDKKYPTCHGCHGAAVERTDTKGTNFFSNMLVSFEPAHKVRSHYLTLPDQPGQGIGPDMLFEKTDSGIIRFTLVNSLPHDLPPGSYGDKELFLVLRWQQADGSVVAQKMTLSSVLAPGQEKSFTTSLSKEKQGHGVSIDLFRQHESTGKTTLIRSYPFPLSE